MTADPMGSSFGARRRMSEMATTLKTTVPTRPVASRSNEAFGTLSDLCLSHRPGERPELFGEFRPITLIPRKRAAGLNASIEKLSLTSPR